MADLTNPPDTPDDTQGVKQWGKYIMIAGLASAAWSLGNRYVAGPVEGAIDGLLGGVLPGDSGGGDGMPVRVG